MGWPFLPGCGPDLQIRLLPILFPCPAGRVYTAVNKILPYESAFQTDNQIITLINGKNQMAYQANESIYRRINKICLKAYDENNTDPIEVIQEIWDDSDFLMHCPEHHVLVPAVLLTVYRTLRGDSREQLEEDLDAADERGRNILPGFCGYYGACGAGIGGGIFFSLLTDTTPISGRTWGMANEITSRCLGHIAELGGPRCCKRVSFAAIETTLAFMKDKLNLEIDLAAPIECRHHENNRECLKKGCPYYPGE